MKKRKIKAFSLLEILVSLFIIILVSGLVSIKLIDLLKEYKFKNSVSGLFEDLMQTKLFSTSYQCDCSLKIFKKKSRYFYQIVPDVYHTKGSVFLVKELKGINLIQSDGKPVGSIEYPMYIHGVFDNLVCLEFSREATEDQQEKLWITCLDGQLQLSSKMMKDSKSHSFLLKHYELSIDK